MKLKFQKEKETKNTVKYQEAAEPGKPSAIGTLYLQKWFAGDTTQLTITIDGILSQVPDKIFVYKEILYLSRK